MMIRYSYVLKISPCQSWSRNTRQGTISIGSSVLRGVGSIDTKMLRRVGYSSLNLRSPFKCVLLAKLVDFSRFTWHATRWHYSECIKLCCFREGFLRQGAATLIERKSRVPQIRGIKGDAVVVYCEPLITKKMGCYRLSQRVNKMGFFLKFISHL